MPRTPKPTNAPEGTVWFGGDVERVRVCLRVLGDDLDPTEITRLFGCEPTQSGRKGEPYLQEKRLRRTGVWILDYTPGPDATVGEAITAILVQLPQDAGLWRNLGQQFKIDLLCDVTVRGVNQGFVLAPEVLKSIAALGIPLGVDIFTEADTEQSALLRE